MDIDSETIKNWSELSKAALLIIAVIALAFACVKLWMHNVKGEKERINMMNQNLIDMKQIIKDGVAATERHTAATETQNEINKEMKSLLHTVNTNILEMKFSRNKKG